MRNQTKNFIKQCLVFSLLTVPALIIAIFLWTVFNLVKISVRIMKSILLLVFGLLLSLVFLALTITTSPIALFHFYKYSYKEIEIEEDSYPFSFLYKSLDIMERIEKNI